MAKNNLSFKVDADDGLKALMARAAPDQMESALRRAAVAGARVYFDEIYARTPVADPERPLQPWRKKRLREALLIAYRPEDSVTGKRATYMVGFSADGWIARLLEFGTSKMAAEPFIRPSYEAMQDTAAQVAGDTLKGALIGD